MLGGGKMAAPRLTPSFLQPTVETALSSGNTRLQLPSCSPAIEHPRNAEQFQVQELHLSGTLSHETFSVAEIYFGAR